MPLLFRFAHSAVAQRCVVCKERGDRNKFVSPLSANKPTFWNSWWNKLFNVITLFGITSINQSADADVERGITETSLFLHLCNQTNIVQQLMGDWGDEKQGHGEPWLLSIVPFRRSLSLLIPFSPLLHLFSISSYRVQHIAKYCSIDNLVTNVFSSLPAFFWVTSIAYKW